MFSIVGRPVGVTKGKVAESRAAVLIAISAQYCWVNSVSPISPCVIGTVEMANRCPVSTMVELKISAGRFNKSASLPQADRVASASFAVGLNLLSKLLHHCLSRTRPRSLQISVTRNGTRARQRSCRRRPRIVGPRALEQAAWKLWLKSGWVSLKHSA